jgi:hypothetical protein
MAQDRTAEFRALLQEYCASKLKKDNFREDAQASEQRRKRNAASEAFLSLSVQTLRNLRQFALLLRASSSWFADARNYDYSPTQRSAFEASCTKLLQELLANLVALRDLAEWPRGGPISSARTQHRLAVVEIISKQVDDLNQYIRRLVTASKNVTFDRGRMTHRIRGTFASEASSPRAAISEEARLKKPFADQSTYLQYRKNNFQPATSLAAGTAQDMAMAQQQMTVQPPVFLWENELAERDRLTQSIEQRMVEVSQLLHQFSIEVVQQDHLIDSLLEDARGSNLQVERANRELDRLHDANHPWHITVITLFLVMALSLLILDRLK